ncbi:phage holin family protein [Timonella sp. A28]|uniref:phage holin family protein n=1 Tax=Timonella sp. A28 TaxID=3442640 RepID=UPI003EC1030B
MADQSAAPQQEPQSEPESASTRRASIGELIAQVSEQFSRLVRAEIAALKAEMAQKAAKTGLAIGLFVGAGVFALYGLGYLFFAGYQGFANLVSPWAAALLTALAIFLICSILVAVGKKTLDRNTPPIPSETIQQMKDDVSAIKDGLK